MMRTRRARSALIATLAVFGLLLGSTPGLAATATGSFSATCDPASYPYGTDGIAYQHPYGTFKIKQVAPSPRASSVTATSQNGNNLQPFHNITNGETATWTNVLAGQYKVKARLSAGYNCNGAWPGNGNYTFQYRVTY